MDQITIDRIRTGAHPKLREQYYLVYETRNLINNIKYIGSHSTFNLNDGYLGSGNLFREALKEFGKQNFKREIIALLPNRKIMLDTEKSYCTRLNLKDNINYYNKTNKGIGYIFGRKHDYPMPEEEKHKRRLIRLGIKLSPETCKKISLLKQGNKNMLGKTHSQKTKDKIRNSKIGIPYTEERNKKLENNTYRRDKNIYKFINKNTQEIFIGTQYELYTKFNLNQTNINSMIRGKCKSIKGWMLN